MEDEYGIIAIRIGRPDLRVNLFTESELAAAELLVQLSESATSASSRDRGLSSSTTSSPRSVNTRLDVREGDDSEDEMAALPTRKKRYRMLSDIYKSTICLGGGAEEKQNNSKRRKRKREEEGERAMAML